jgi:protease I
MSTAIVDNRIAVPTGEPAKGRIAILTADQVEEVEFFYPYYRFVEAGYLVDVITPAGGPLTGARGFGIHDTMPLAKANPDNYLMLFVPGGAAPAELRANPDALAFVRAFWSTDKAVGAVCHGPSVLAAAGVAAGRTLTSWPEVAPMVVDGGGNWVDAPVVVDGRLFTGRKPGDLPAELLRIMRYLESATAAGGDRA